jgi:hypothetical protein
MSFLERAKQAAEQARQAASETAGRAQAAIGDPATAEKARQALGRAKRGLSTAIDRIDPGVLADVIIKATALQEKANHALREKGSPYRIAEIGIGASIPPSVTFSIGRVDDPTEGALPEAGVASSELVTRLGTMTAEQVQALDGTKLDAADLETPSGTTEA